MGVINHNAIVATTWSKDRANRLSLWISELDGREQGLFIRCDHSLANESYTFCLCPDGSKEGWEDSGAGDRLRDSFVSRLDADNYEDGTSPWNYVEVGFGEYGQKIIRGNNRNCYNDLEYAGDGE